MIKQIDGQHYRNLLDYGMRNLSLYRDEVNSLNVFPVPDGDTGTNMVLTLQNGFSAIEGVDGELSELAKKFSHAVVFGARGNSGVILSQFFKGFSECFFGLDSADCSVFAKAFEKGVKCAYQAVSNPTEGTMLTVLREATEVVCAKTKSGYIQSIDDSVIVFLKEARTSLANTPELLPILKSAGVVDSGGAGIIYAFEGMLKYINGENIEKVEIAGAPATQSIDFTLYNRDSKFEFGYCTELLLQLTNGKKDFDYDAFKQELNGLGNSIVTSYGDEKVKIHIHTHFPEQVFTFCHEFGEFLTIKVENMSVQHNETKENASAQSVYTDSHKGCFSVLAVAHDASMKDYFIDMGADIVIMGDRLCPPSASDFIDAFNKTDAEAIFVFANGKNTAISAEQAAKLYEKSKIVVFSTRSDSECYATLPMIDFESEDIDAIAEDIRANIDNIKTVTVSVAQKDACFEGKSIHIGDIIALEGSSLVAVGDSYKGVTNEAIKAVFEDEEKDVVLLFANEKISSDILEDIEAFVADSYPYTEINTIMTKDDFYGIVISFE